MELKRPSAGVSSVCAASFESHLYGIETIEGRRKVTGVYGLNRTFMELKPTAATEAKDAASGLNRTFMELKLWMLERGSPTLMRLNRTFMELKLLIQNRNPNHDEFESHLYGIETGMSEHIVAHKPSLNRTFMELKPESIKKYLPEGATFESHLYGIETIAERRSCHAHNAFESHLYGIETSFVTPVCTLRRRLNRTFMELKRRLSAPTPEYRPPFESHLYGIETFHSSMLLVDTYSLNRTFMELKHLIKHVS